MADCCGNRSTICDEDSGQLICRNCGTVLDEWLATKDAEAVADSSANFPFALQLRSYCRFFGLLAHYEAAGSRFQRFLQLQQSQRPLGDRGFLFLLGCLFLEARSASVSIGSFSGALSIDKFRFGRVVSQVRHLTGSSELASSQPSFSQLVEQVQVKDDCNGKASLLPELCALVDRCALGEGRRRVVTFGALLFMIGNGDSEILAFCSRHNLQPSTIRAEEKRLRLAFCKLLEGTLYEKEATPRRVASFLPEVISFGNADNLVAKNFTLGKKRKRRAA